MNDGVPATWKRPDLTSSTTSSALASSRSAATRRARSTRASVAVSTAAPPTCSEREPKVPVPSATRSVSPATTSMSAMGMPVRSLAIMAHDVRWPCPWLDEPVKMVARPSAWISTLANSVSPGAGPAVTST